jgi:hypothetical protein
MGGMFSSQEKYSCQGWENYGRYAVNLRVTA